MSTTTLPPYRALRQATGLSLRAVARALDMDSGRLSTIERGLIPTAEERERLLAFLTERILNPLPPEQRP
mgnify:CR=1 FL=1